MAYISNIIFVIVNLQCWLQLLFFYIRSFMYAIAFVKNVINFAVSDKKKIAPNRP